MLTSLLACTISAQPPDAAIDTASDCEATAEICDGLDNDCNGTVDDEADDALAYFADADGDGYGDLDGMVFACLMPEGHVENERDCDDTDPTVHPGADETCDDDDEDCDGDIDDTPIDGGTWHRDLDGDGYGDPTYPAGRACDQPAGWVDNEDDCNDDDGAIHPGVGEVCDDGVDNDCDGTPGPCGLEGGSLAEADAIYTGADAGYWAGLVVSGNGDVNGDGYDDLLVAGYPAWGNTGAAWMVTGSALPTGGSLWDAPQWYGASGGAQAGNGGAIVGDVDADGFDDFVVGATGNDIGGSAHLVLGGSDLAGGSLSGADATFDGEAVDDQVGVMVAPAGDVDRDGFDDLLFAGRGANGYAGAAWIRWGDARTVGGAVDAMATRFDGAAAYDEFGYGLAGAGDVDGDGGNDLVFGCYGADAGGSDAGAAWFVDGGYRVGGGKIDDVATARFDGTAAGAEAGRTTDGAGDVDGDGYGDLLIGGEYAAYVVRGGTTMVGGSLADAHGVVTPSAGTLARGVAGAGDIDGDGFADVLIGAHGTTGDGGAWLVSGAASVPTGDLEATGVYFGGENAGDGAGYALDAAGDVNGDGRLDLVVGAYGNDGAAADAGAAYLLLGHGM